MAWLRRPLRLGQRLGDFALTVTMNRVGGQIEVQASVHDAAGDFAGRWRRADWHTALRDMVRDLSTRLHTQYLQQSLAP